MAAYDKETNPHARPSREGMKTVVLYVPQDMSDALRMLSIHERTTVQALGKEALETLLKQRNIKFKAIPATREKVG